jgi:hypothetical protein
MSTPVSIDAIRTRLEQAQLRQVDVAKLRETFLRTGWRPGTANFFANAVEDVYALLTEVERLTAKENGKPEVSCSAPLPETSAQPPLKARLAEMPGYLNGYDAETEADQRHAYDVGFSDAVRCRRHYERPTFTIDQEEPEIPDRRPDVRE